LPLAALVTVPVRVPVGPRGDRSTAAKALSLPSPQTLLSSAVPPHWASGVSVAESSRIALVASTLPISDGAALHMRATVPAVCGEAIDDTEGAPHVVGVDRRDAPLDGVDGLLGLAGRRLGQFVCVVGPDLADRGVGRDAGGQLAGTVLDVDRIGDPVHAVVGIRAVEPGPDTGLALVGRALERLHDGLAALGPVVDALRE